MYCDQMAAVSDTGGGNDLPLKGVWAQPWGSRMGRLVIQEELRVAVLVLHNERSKLNSTSDQDASLKPPT